MFLKIVAFAAFVAVAKAGFIGAPLAYSAPAVAHAPLAYSAPIAKVAAPLAYAAPVAKAVVQEEYDPHPQYSYAYDIQDGLTGDNKQQQESRDGDVVQGSYSLVEPDGTRRVVQYQADPVNGFNAVVSREPLAVKVAAPVVAKAVAPVAYAAPVAKVAAPLAYAAPVARVAAPYASPYASPYAAPLAYSSPLYKHY
ncbi:Insect cuticle protein [Popillia japonica]|uniref:Insect cuticle protein n=1 Tax=Popillia japonica TaxID=7064 RepID=A0AAW1MGU6_POPJA